MMNSMGDMAMGNTHMIAMSVGMLGGIFLLLGIGGVVGYVFGKSR